MAVRARLEGILVGLLGPGNAAAFRNLIDQAVREGWTAPEFEAAVYQSQEFRQMFPGIFRSDGSLRMTASEYREMSDSYRSIARTYGFRVNDARIGKLISGDVSIDEFTDRAEAIQRVSDFKPAFEQFRQALRARGISTAGLDTDQDIANFILGKGPELFYKIWEETSVGTAAKMAGINLGGKITKQIARRTPGVLSEAEMQAQMQDLARHIKTTLPMSKIQKMGLSKKDLVQLEFGGPRQAEIKQKAERILKSHEAFFQSRSHTGQTRRLGEGQQESAQSF